MTQTSMGPGSGTGLEAERSSPGAAWTVEEIAQQPKLWREVGRRCLQGGVTDFLAPLMSRPDVRVVLTGAGTSAFAGGVLAPALARALGRRVEALATTDIVSNPRDAFAAGGPTLLVSFARSGDSPESVAATRLADEVLQECHHLAITCDVDGRLAREHMHAPRSHVLLMPEAANDRGFAMTSSYSCMVLAARLALDPVAGLDNVERLATAAEQVLATAPQRTRELAAKGFGRIVYLGSGPLTALARESALKLLELTAGRVVTYFDSPLGFRHGPKSVLDDSTLVIVYVSNDPYTRRYDIDIVAELRSVLPEDHVIAIAADGTDMAAAGGVTTWLVNGLEAADDTWLSLAYVLFAQLLAVQVSVSMGLTPDNPFPSGEVNRVVRGVTIHPLPDAAR